MDLLDEPVSELGYSVRTTNMLETAGIFTLRDLLHSTESFLLQQRNCGVVTMKEIYNGLESLGFYRESARNTSASTGGR